MNQGDWSRKELIDLLGKVLWSKGYFPKPPISGMWQMHRGFLLEWTGTVWRKLAWEPERRRHRQGDSGARAI
jgi:hypothetical protein